MDRESMQKIGRIIWIFATAAVVLALFISGMRIEGRIRGQQMNELTVIYPEAVAEIQDNFAYYENRTACLKLAVMAAVLLAVVIFCAGYASSLKREKRSRAAENDRELDDIYEQLLKFHKGDFEMLPFPEKNAGADRAERIYEKLRELGGYFSDLKERLAREENSTKTLITDISHQLKTPLSSILISHELAASTDLSEDERKDFLAAEKQEIRKMEVLLDELMKLSRLENNMIQIRPEKNGLRQTVREAVGQIFMKAHAKNIEICVEIARDAEIFHDRKWTVEAFANILENAVKYSGAGTTVSIRVCYLPHNALIEIEDEGVGIPEVELHEIFKRFYRGQTAKRLAKEGAGVGLYLARMIIEQQGGTVMAQRKIDHGTVFKIMLPLLNVQVQK